MKERRDRMYVIKNKQKLYIVPRFDSFTSRNLSTKVVFKKRYNRKRKKIQFKGGKNA